MCLNLAKFGVNRMGYSNDDSVGDVPACCFGWSHDFKHVASLQSKVSRNGVSDLNFRQLMLLNAIFLHKLKLLLLAQNLMFWHQLVMGDIDLEIVKREDFQIYHEIILLLLGQARLLSHDHNGFSHAQG